MVKKENKKDDDNFDSILDIKKAEVLRKSIEPETTAQGRLAREGVASFGIFLDIMDRVAQLKYAKFKDKNDLRDFEIDNTIVNKEARLMVVEIVKASATRVKEVLDTVKNMNRPSSPFGILGRVMNQAQNELDIPEEVPVFEQP